METRDITKIEMRKGASGSGYFTDFDFFFKKGGTKYYIQSVGVALNSERVTDIKISNSKTGEQKILLIDSELKNGRYKDTYFFSKN